MKIDRITINVSDVLLDITNEIMIMFKFKK